jgi:hypothetical protein
MEGMQYMHQGKLMVWWLLLFPNPSFCLLNLSYIISTYGPPPKRRRTEEKNV